MNTLTRGVTAVVVAAVVLASVTPFALVGTVAAATHTVDDSGGADFTSIQAAVDAAAAGDTINVAPGTYSESVLIDKPLTLVGDPGDGTAGAGANAPVLDGGASPYAFWVYAGGDGTTIEGFDIGSANTYALNVVVDDGETLSDLTFRHNDVTGAEVQFALKTGTVQLERAEISNNVFSGGKIDVNGDAPSDLTITGLSIVDNVMTSSSGDAIDFDLEATTTDATVVVSGNTITGAGADAIEFELDAEDTYEITVEENHIDGAASEGIEFLDNGGSGMTATIARNDIRNSGGAGIEIAPDGDATRLQISQNNIVGNTRGIDSSETDPGQVVDARNNYWGASDGPSSATASVLADPVDTTTLADGSGDSVSGTLSTSGDPLSNVRFAPFATVPFGDDGKPLTTASGGAQFELGDASFSPSNPVVGQSVTISVSVTNEGDATGTFRGMFRSDFIGHEVVDFRLAPGETRTVSTTVVYGDAKSYNVYLDDEYVGSLNVESRDPMRVTVDADPANDTVTASVENPRRTAIDITVPAVNAGADSGVVLTNVQVTPETIDDFQFEIAQSASPGTMANATNASNASAMVLPDGTAPVSTLEFDSTLENDDIESVVLTFEVDTSRYPSLADATVGDAVSMYRYDQETSTSTKVPAEVVATANGSLTATVRLDGLSTYLVGVDRAAFDVATSVAGNPVASGDSLSFVFEVTNTGDGPGMYAPTVAVAGVPVEAGHLTLAPGESDTLVVVLPAEVAGVWPITVDGRLRAIAFVDWEGSDR